MYVKRIDMKGKGGLSTPYFGIYIDPNTLPDDDFWHVLRDHFGSLIYESTMYGTGMVQPPSYCPICHGCDHPRGLCPFPLLPAWKGMSRDSPKRGFKGRSNDRNYDNKSGYRD
ncbi:hypothetical protein FA95DRAFT_1353972 [Auriscalpium vulgare]|uniref:Uncharacterized protein n=1 Tax=Auriscalpium vulgare TaxID=40419 RepID=A0ACB8R241_9AGAM|nr:hypothetical protein FA95DRAFT_1353972 [Auriscalpium vulgare]